MSHSREPKQKGADSRILGCSDHRNVGFISTVSRRHKRTGKQSKAKQNMTLLCAYGEMIPRLKNILMPSASSYSVLSSFSMFPVSLLLSHFNMSLPQRWTFLKKMLEIHAQRISIAVTVGLGLHAGTNNNYFLTQHL